MAEKCQRQHAAETLCLFARCPPRMDYSSGTCHGRSSAASCRGTVEVPVSLRHLKLHDFDVDVCNQRWVYHLDCRRPNGNLIDHTEPTLQYMIFIGMMDYGAALFTG